MCADGCRMCEWCTRDIDPSEYGPEPIGGNRTQADDQ